MIDPRTRLHISPFSRDLLNAILPASSLALAQNISYHTLQTFPENNYGYLELPSMEAEKIRKKLNGSILKGKKIRIEEARPLKRQREDGEDGARVDSTSAPELTGRRSSKRSKKIGSTLNGRELSPDRKVKRGWTEPKNEKPRKSRKDKTAQTASKYTDKEELLFKTKLPPNRVSNVKGEIKKKSKGKSQDVLVHEFSKSTIQPSFLREHTGTPKNKKATAYIDGKGWVDEDGLIVEEEHPGRRSRASTTSTGRNFQERGSERPKDSSSGSEHQPSSESTSESGPESEDSDGERPAIVSTENPPNHIASSTSSSATSAASESKESSSQPSLSEATEVEKRDLVQTSPNTSNAPVPSPAIHPLEALFKRPATKQSSKPTSLSASQEKDIPKPSLELQTTFSFFGSGASIDEPQIDQLRATPPVPATPFTSLDFHARTIRSAAPTPDTAAPSRFNSWGHGRSSSSSSSPSSLSSENIATTPSEDDEDTENKEKNTSNNKATKPQAASKATITNTKTKSKPKGKAPTSNPDQSNKNSAGGGDEEKEESAFKKAFWEGRGEFNRSWKQRRRESLKLLRQRENRSSASAGARRSQRSGAR